MTNATLALEHGDEGDIEQARNEYKEMALAFWKEAEETAKKPKKLHRTKVYSWLRGTHHALKVATGRGWEQFKVAGPPSSWPSVTLAVDQGSDGWSAAHFLASEGLNILIVGDVSHRTWTMLSLPWPMSA